MNNPNEYPTDAIWVDISKRIFSIIPEHIWQTMSNEGKQQLNFAILAVIVEETQKKEILRRSKAF